MATEAQRNGTLEDGAQTIAPATEPKQLLVDLGERMLAAIAKGQQSAEQAKLAGNTSDGTVTTAEAVEPLAVVSLEASHA